MEKFETDKYFIGYSGGKDYSTFNTFEASVLDNDPTAHNHLIVVGIINPDVAILSEIEQYLSNKFYNYGIPDICLFTNSGLILACKKNSNWIQANDDIENALELPKLNEAVLNELIDESLEKVFVEIDKTKRQLVVDVILKSTFQKIASLIASDVNYLEHIEWRDLERILGEALAKIGFKVKVTPPSKDGGKDIIANFDVHNEEYSFIIELKHWRSGKKVGPDYVEKFLRVVINEKRSGGLFLSSYGYSEDCLDILASFRRFNLNLGNRRKIYSIFQIYEKRLSGLILSPQDLLAVMSEDVIEAKGV